MLRILAEQPEASLRQLRQRLALHPATVGQAIDQLVERGLCTRRPDPADLRARLISITAAGRALLNKAPLAGPVRLRYTEAPRQRLQQLTDALGDAIDLFGLGPWAPTPYAEESS
ncbi:MAG: MarR family transcriptional regulator [Chloroflexi bacterium]|nr:MarR family transcriptional regulator [Chloroflexota bacterium]